MTGNGHEAINITADEVQFIETGNHHILSSKGLAALMWLSFVALVFLILLDVVPPNFRAGAVASFFFMMGAVCGVGFRSKSRQGDA